jgi:hypothetical protein
MTDKPWMIAVERGRMSEADAKRCFDRLEPTRDLHDRAEYFRKIVESYCDERDRVKARRTAIRH